MRGPSATLALVAAAAACASASGTGTATGASAPAAVQSPSSLSPSSPSPLFDALSSALFKHESLVNSTDVYKFLYFPCSGLETENATMIGQIWGTGVLCIYLYLVPSLPFPDPGLCAAGSNTSTVRAGVDTPGNDYNALWLPVDNPSMCASICCADVFCSAWSYTAQSYSYPFNCVIGAPCCYLKSSQPPVDLLGGLWTSGTVDRTGPGAQPVHPPLGMRSSVSLGGLGAGFFELRADGSVHEMTIWNQSPAGATKFGVVPDFYTALRVVSSEQPGPVTRAIRTHPPAYAQGVPQLAYSGAQPLSRLGINDPALAAAGVGATLYAYSTLVPGDMRASAFPAVTFTLALQNTDPTNAANVSFLLAIPFGAVENCGRNSDNTTSLTRGVASFVDCLHSCAAAGTACASWTYVGAQSACVLNADVPLSLYQEGSWCGVSGDGWASVDGLGLTLSMAPPGGTGTAPVGDLTVRPVPAPAAGASSSSSASSAYSVSFGVADDAAALYSAFAADGAFLPGAPGLSGAGGVFGPVVAAQGAAAISATVAPGSNLTLSIVFAWSFPNRDHNGQVLGNFYDTLFPEGSPQVASALADEATLTSVVTSLTSHHAVYFNANSSLPDWLADHFVNQMSHMRGFIWLRDGRTRMFEAYGIADIDSVHNDHQRHLPYLWLATDFEVNKMRAWASFQDKTGFINECLSPYEAPMDTPGGRIMADVTTVWVLELLELWRNTGDESLLEELWPNAVAALQWMLSVSSDIGLPLHLPCTYDQLSLDNYNTTTFNSFVYLAALSAGSVMAGHVNDTATKAAVDAGLARGQVALQELLWNETSGYYVAYTGGGPSGALQSDCLYGQVLAHAYGLGWLAPPAQIGRHLATELAWNSDPYGLRVIVGMPAKLQPEIAPWPPFPAPNPPGVPLDPDPQFGTIWNGGAPDWSYLALALMPTGFSPVGNDTTAALAVAARTLDNYRSRLNNMWDIAALNTASGWGGELLDGMPYDVSHYGFVMTTFFLVTALSGQQTDLAAGTLSFAPAYPCPFNLPVVSAGLEGTLSCALGAPMGGTYTLALAFGTLSLPAGGLSANGRTYPGAVALAAGQAVSW
jgi:non-lysosomal glucosylceramidase